MPEQPTPLEAAILRTMCWFSVFEYPLTSFEIWKWLLEPDRSYELAQVMRVLESSSWLQDRIDSEGGFYALRGTVHHSTTERRRRFLDAVRKYKKLRKASRYFSMLPGVRAVCAVNSLAWWHTSEQSDIDLFIVTRLGSIWSSRFFLVFPFAVLKQRPDSISDSVSDPFCFSFFVAQDHLQLESLKVASHDPYLCYWVKSVVPMFDKDAHLEAFESTNRWATSVLPNARIRSVHHTQQARSRIALPIQTRALEPFFRWLQHGRMPKEIIELANKDTRVVVHDGMLKFHGNDRRQEYAERYQHVLARYI